MAQQVKAPALEPEDLNIVSGTAQSRRREPFTEKLPSDIPHAHCGTHAYAKLFLKSSKKNIVTKNERLGERTRS